MATQHIWLLELEWAGRTWYLATCTCDMIDSNGNPYHYQAGLSDVHWTTDSGTPGEASLHRSISLTILLPCNVAEMVDLGYTLAGSTGRLYRWRFGDYYEARKFMLRGQIVDPVYGVSGDSIECSLEAHASVAPSTFPEVDAVISQETWPLAESAALNCVYPFVFGRPGSLDQGTDRIPGTPGLVVDGTSRYLLIAGHSVSASQVNCIDMDADTPAWRLLTVGQVDDGLGRRCSIVTLPTSGDCAYVAGHSYYVAWTQGGGISWHGSELKRAGDLLMYLLERTKLPIDRGKCQAVADLLSGYEVAGYIDESIDPWEWLKSNLLPLLPITITAGANGLYPILWRYNATSRSVTGVVDADTGVAKRVTKCSEGNLTDVVNDIRIDYALNAFSGKYLRSARVTGMTTGSLAKKATRLARISQDRYGRCSTTLSSDIVYDAATAYAIANWRVASQALPSRTIDYGVPYHYHYREGDLVFLTDNEMHWTNRMAMITSIIDNDEGGCVYTLRLLER